MTIALYMFIDYILWEYKIIYYTVFSRREII